MSEEQKVLNFTDKPEEVVLPNFKQKGSANYSVAALQIRRHDLANWSVQHRIYVHPRAQAGKADLSHAEMIEEVIERYQKKIVQYRYSTMKPLKRAFFEDSIDRWVYGFYGNKIYSEIKSMFIYSVAEEMQVLKRATTEYIVEVILGAFGFETHNVLARALDGQISKDAIMAIRNKVIETRIISNALDLFKDRRFDDSYTKDWEWLTDELIGISQDRFLLRSPKIPRQKNPRRAFPKLSEELKLHRKNNKPTEKDHEEVRVFLGLPLNKRLNKLIKKDSNKLTTKKTKQTRKKTK